MSDLPYVQQRLEVSITGQDATGNQVNFVSADVNGNLLVKDYANGSVTGGTAAPSSLLIGGQYNSSLPTLTTAQQSAIQLDVNGRLIIRPLTSADVVSAVQSGTWTVQQGTPPWSVGGNVASAATDAGNPVKIGGVFNTALPTVTTGQRVDLQATSHGSLEINLRDATGAERGITSAPTDVRIGDGSDTVAVSATGNMKVVDGLSGGGVFGQVSIPTAGTAVEAKVGASRLTNRKFLQIYCNQAGMFWGLSAAVTTTTGTPLANGQVISFGIDPDSSFAVFIVGNANGKTIQVVECP